jgi:hypothetical protein
LIPVVKTGQLLALDEQSAGWVSTNGLDWKSQELSPAFTAILNDYPSNIHRNGDNTQFAISPNDPNTRLGFRCQLYLSENGLDCNVSLSITCDEEHNMFVDNTLVPFGQSGGWAIWTIAGIIFDYKQYVQIYTPETRTWTATEIPHEVSGWHTSWMESFGGSNLLLSDESYIWMSKDGAQSWSKVITEGSNTCELDGISSSRPQQNALGVAIIWFDGCAQVYDEVSDAWSHILVDNDLFNPVQAYVDPATNYFFYLSANLEEVVLNEKGQVVAQGTASQLWNMGGQGFIEAHTVWNDAIWLYGTNGFILNSTKLNF